MLNYLKSELYRVFHSSGIYLFIGICSLLVLAMNLILWGFNLKTENFYYANIDFSFSMLTSDMNIVLFLTAALASIITVDEFKFRTINNSIAFGISRIKIYISKILVALLASLLCLAIVEGVLIGSGYLLLDSSNFHALTELLIGTAACIPSFIASLIAFISLYLLLSNMTSSIWTWIGIIVAFPTITSLLGMKIKFFDWLSSWLIFNIVGASTLDENQMLIYMWSSAKGMQHCLLAGFLGIVIFLIFGILTFRKKEI